MNFTNPDETNANAYAEHVISVLVKHNQADPSIASDAALKQVLAMWLVFLSEVLPEELNDARRFVLIALEHQRLLIGLAEEHWQKRMFEGDVENPHRNAMAISFWNPILLPLAAMYLTGDEEMFGEIYSAYWSVFTEQRSTEMFPQLPLDSIISLSPDLDEKTRNTFVAHMRELANYLIQDHYETAYLNGLTGEDPEKYTDHLLETWERIWQIMAKNELTMDTHTMRLYFLLQTLGPVLACDFSADYAKQVAAMIEERTKHGWHGFYPNIDT